jgi:hypothetical protein
MTLRVFKAVSGSGILVTLPNCFPEEFDRRLWRDAIGYPDNALSAQVRSDGFVLGRLIGDIEAAGRHDG